jgi:histidinol phosphatase-like enzyme (inositol monophosphatase family)
MTTDQPSIKSLLDFAIDIARGAGEITLRHFRGSFAIDRKKDGSFVTAADREAEAYLRERIEKTFPQDAIIGEESGQRAGSSGRCWIVDPIDGTYSFVHGVALYGVLIGLEVAGDSVVGVVNLPAVGELVHAGRGLGCFLNGASTRVSATPSLGKALIVATDFGYAMRTPLGPATAELQKRARTARTWGDCYGHMLVATGRAEVALDPIMNVWDCAALLPILEEAGGTFTDWSGKRTIRGGNAISTNGILLPEVLEVVAQHREG